MKCSIINCFAAILLVFTACQKAETLEIESIISTKKMNSNMDQNKTTSLYLDIDFYSIEHANNEIQVHYKIDFLLSDIGVKQTQSLVFVDSSGDESTHHFTVKEFTFNKKKLQLNFILNDQNINNLTLESQQEIIIEDDIIN